MENPIPTAPKRATSWYVPPKGRTCITKIFPKGSSTPCPSSHLPSESTALRVTSAHVSNIRMVRLITAIPLRKRLILSIAARNRVFGRLCFFFILNFRRVSKKPGKGECNARPSPVPCPLLEFLQLIPIEFQRLVAGQTLLLHIVDIPVKDGLHSLCPPHILLLGKGD